MDWYLSVLEKYADFSGRARRSKFWMFALVNFFIGVALSVLGWMGHGLGLVAFLYAAAVLSPGIAVGVRRLHDTGRSGWMLLVGLIPFVGALVLLVFHCLDGAPGDNQYGPNPKAHSLQAALG